MNFIEILKKYQDIALYLFFGICTTLINVFTYWIFAHLVSISTILSSILAWMAAVLFAYITNRTWVFHSQVKGIQNTLNECFSFFCARLMTGIIDWVGMYIFVDLLKWNDLYIKIGINILVIFLNYIASKLIIFKTKVGE